VAKKTALFEAFLRSKSRLAAEKPRKNLPFSRFDRQKKSAFMLGFVAAGPVACHA